MLAVLHAPAYAAPVQILYYEPLRAEAVASTAAAQKPSDAFAYSFEAFGRRFDLTLTRNERIALAKPSSSHSTAPLRLYKGAIEGVAGSWVRLGVQGDRVHGLLWDGREVFVIEPVEVAQAEVAPPIALPFSGSIVFRLSDTHVDTPTACAATHTAPQRTGLDQYKAVVSEISAAAGAIVASNPTRRIELSAMGDALYRQSHLSDESAVNEVLLRLNNVDGIYSAQIGVAIQVPTVLIEPTDGTAFSATTSGNTLLEELSGLRQSTPELRSRGLTHLFTGRDLDGDTVGVAYVKSLCDARYGVGLTQTANLTVWLESLVAAHELGHNFGAYHDGEDAPGNNIGECPTAPNNLYLMAPTVHADHQEFSSCSRTTIRNNVPGATCITPISTADIAVASNIGDTRALAGATFDWSFDVAHVGSATATGATARAVLPPSITIVEAWVTGGTCTAGAGLIDCALGNVNGGVTRTVNARLRSDTAASNTAAVQVNATNDAGLNNNQGQGNIDIEAGVDLSVGLSAPTTIALAQATSAAFTLQNLSSATAHDVTLDFTPTASIAIRSATMGDGACSANGTTMRCSLASLAANATLSGSLTFDASASGAATLTATASSFESDSNSANNTASAAVQVTPPVNSTSTGGGGGGGGTFGWEIVLLAMLRPLARRLRQATDRVNH